MRKLVASAASTLFLTACLFETEIPPIPSSEFAAELARLEDAPNPLLEAYGLRPGGSLVGLQFAFTSLDYARDVDSNVEAFHAQSGVYPAMVGAYFDFTARPERMAAFLAAVHAQGAVPAVTLDPKIFGDKNTAYQKTFLARIAEGKFDAQLSAWARVLGDFGHPLLLRFAHEMNGEWYPYAGGGDADGDQKPDGPEAYIGAWRYVHDLFTKEGAVNLIWVFCPNAEDFPDRDWNRPFRYYPGDDYVDLIAVDAYEHHEKRVQSLSEALDPFLSAYGAFLRDRLRNGIGTAPAFGLGEFGTNRVRGASKAAWYREALPFLGGERRIGFHFLYNGQDGGQDFSLRNLAGLLGDAYTQSSFRYRFAGEESFMRSR